MPKTLYIDEYSISRFVGKNGKAVIRFGSTDELPENFCDDLDDRALLVFDGTVLNVAGWTQEQREAEDIRDSACDEYWRGTLRPATREEVLAVFFGEDSSDA